MPSPNGSLSKIVPSTSISIVNREVKTLIEEAGTPGSKREINIRESPKIVSFAKFISHEIYPLYGIQRIRGMRYDCTYIS